MASPIHSGFRRLYNSAVLAPILHTTISSDGRMVATLAHGGTEKQRLRVRHLDTDTHWRTVPVPQYTRTICFGLLGHELLLTHTNPSVSPLSYLGKLDLDRPEHGVQTLYAGVDLAFPMEVTPGQVMVRTHLPPGPFRQVWLGSFYWLLVGPGQQIQRVGPENMLPHSAPNIVGTGFFWVEHQLREIDAPHPLLLKYAFPGGKVPDTTSEQFDKNTYSIRCDRRAHRCLRTYISNLGQPGRFVYNVEAFLGAERCPVPGVAGYCDALSVTPDGTAAVMGLAPSNDKPRHVVVMHFKPQQCAPTSVQHIYFD